ncbi:MAG: beta-galactosidase, partial [Bacteroidota bacterium]
DGYVSLPGTTRGQNAAFANLRHGPENVSRVVPENKDESLVRVPCLSDPEYRVKTAERIEKMAQEVRPYGVTEWSLGDESTLGQRDYCISPSCLAAFRKYLQAQYRTLDALNTSWGSSFASWEQAVPATLAEVDRKPNLAPWLDHRRYMESLFAEYHDWCKGLITKHIPAARVGISGTPNVNSYSGHDWWKLMQGPLTHLSSYGGVQREMQRSFARPGTFVSSFLGYDYTDDDEQRARYGPWDLVFHGSNGVNYYTLVSNTLNCPLIRPDMSLTNKAPWYFEEVAQLKSGFGRLFMSARYANDGIAVHYSPASVHAATATGLFDNRDRLRRYDNNLSNLGMILSQLHLQYNFVHEEQMAKGDLSKYRVLILPWSSAISAREAAAIREFVQKGGTVIADSYCGVRDDHGAPRAMLDDLFGIKQTLTPPQLQAADMTGPNAAVPVASGSADLGLAGGRPLATIGTMPAYIVNQVGKGKAIFLNSSFSNYAEVSAGGVAGETLDQEVAPETVTAPIRSFVQSLLKDAAVQAPVLVTCRGNEDAAVETSRLRLDQAELIGVVRGITAGAVNASDLLSCKLTLPQKRFVYDSRAGKCLGEVTQIEDRLPRGIARVYALLPYQVGGVGLSAPVRIQAGSPLELKLAVRPTNAAATVGTHVLHVTVAGPDGKPRTWYDRNVVAAGGRATLAIPLAFNDEPGTWTISVRDIATGVTGKTTVTVGTK